MAQLGLMLLVQKYKGTDMHCNNGLNNKLVESLVENKVAQETGDLKYLQDSMYDFVKTLKEIILGEYSSEFFNKYVDEALKLHGSNLEEFLKIPKMGLELRQALNSIDEAIDTTNQEFRDNLVLLLDRFQTTLDNMEYQARDPYDTAVELGFEGTKEEWLEHLEGDSAYKLATLKGFQGTEEEWLDHLEGDSAYEVAVKNGFVGTQSEWLKYIRADGFIQSIQQFATNDSETQVQIPDYGTIYSLQGYIKQMFETGGVSAETFRTYQEMVDSLLEDGDTAYVLSDDAERNGLYIKSAGEYVRTGYDFYNTLKRYTETELFDIKELPSTLYNDIYVGSLGNTINIDKAHVSGEYNTYEFSLEKDVEYKIFVRGASKRMRIAAISVDVDMQALIDSETEQNVRATEIYYDDEGSTDFEYIFNSKGYVKLYIYVGVSPTNAKPVVTENSYEFKFPIIADGLKSKVTGDAIALNAIKPENTTFMDTVTSVVDTEQLPSNNVLYNVAEDRAYYGAGATPPKTYRCIIKGGYTYRVKALGGENNRFRVVLFRSQPSMGTTADVVVTVDDTLNEIVFTNPFKDDVYLVTTVHVSNIISPVYAEVTEEMYEIAGLAVNGGGASVSNQRKYSLEYGKILDNTQSTFTDTSKAPRLAAVKYEYRDSQLPEPVSYLYTSYKAPYKLLYSEGKIDDIKELATWNRSITHTGNLTPSHYTTYITQQGDIVFIYRGDLAGGDLNPNARQNPIIYPAGDYDNPYVVDFGDREKPTSWARCNGVAPILDGDGFLFNEYTRPAHEKMYIWKVSRPLDNPDNWRRVYELTIDRPGSNHKEGRLKHWHALNYDPWSGAYLASTGDYFEGAKILMSKDIGETWEVQAEGDESLCRLSQFSFDKDAVYWGSDSHGPRHLFIKASRDIDGYPMLGLDDLEVLYTFAGASASITATYNTVRLRNPNGFLFIDRQDGTGNELNLHFWSLDSNEMTKFDSIHRLNGTTGHLGFRCDGLILYQSYTDDRIVLGFNASSATNTMDIAGNSLSNTVANVTLRVTG